MKDHHRSFRRLRPGPMKLPVDPGRRAQALALLKPCKMSRRQPKWRTTMRSIAMLRKYLGKAQPDEERPQATICLTRRGWVRERPDEVQSLSRAAPICDAIATGAVMTSVVSVTGL